MDKNTPIGEDDAEQPPSWMRSHAITLALGVLLGMVILAGVQQLRQQRQAKKKQLELQIQDGGRYRVRRVVDGDTLQLENGLMVRVLGVNTPEKGRWVEDEAPLAEQATEFTRTQVEGQLVKLELGHEGMDAYGRVVARVRTTAMKGDVQDHGGPYLDELLVKEGLARANGLGVDAELRSQLNALEDEAKAQKKGMWGVRHPLLEDPEAARAQFKYCGSSGGDVYHGIDDPAAQRISAQHFIGYETREAAEAAGRRPSQYLLRQWEQAEAALHTDE